MRVTLTTMSEDLRNLISMPKKMIILHWTCLALSSGFALRAVEQLRSFDIKALRNHDHNTQGKTQSMNLGSVNSARYIPRRFASQYIISTTTVCIHLPFVG